MRYLSYLSKYFPIRKFICLIDRSDRLAISSFFFFFCICIDRSVISFDQSYSRQVLREEERREREGTGEKENGEERGLLLQIRVPPLKIKQNCTGFFVYFSESK